MLKKLDSLPFIGLNMSVRPPAGDDPGEALTPLAYIDAIEGAGGIPLCIPPYEDHGKIRRTLPFLKGFLFIGGADYRPEHYGGHPQPEEELVHPRRDRFDMALAKFILEETNLPVLGICGGCQLLSIARGGALIQDIGTEWTAVDGGAPLPHSGRDREISGALLRPGCQDREFSDGLLIREETGLLPPASRQHRELAGALLLPEGGRAQKREGAGRPTPELREGKDDCSGTPPGKEGDAVIFPEKRNLSFLHAVRFASGSLAARATGTPTGAMLATNSFHHQAIHPDRVGKYLIPSAWSADGIIEAIESAPGSPWSASSRFVLGLQWHPERMQDEAPHRQPFLALVKAAAAACLSSY